MKRVGVLLILIIFSMAFFYISFSEMRKSISGNAVFTGGEEDGGGEPQLQPAGLLTEQQAYVRNPTVQTLTNELATIPIGFPSGQYNANNINLVKLSGRPSQTYPTSYYSDGSVRTAVMYALVDVAGGSENIYQIDFGSTAQYTFNYHPAVQAFLAQGEITVISRDINGNAYPVTVPLGSLTPEVDGPIVKKYRYVKAHRKPSGGPHPIEYLFSSVFEIEIVSGQPWIKIQHLIVNSHNLAEDQQTGLNYRDGQLGNMKYQNIEMYLDTHNPSIASSTHVSLLGANSLKPTRVDPKPSLESNRIWIMPTEGQQILYTSYNRYNNNANVPYNYIAPAQGFLTEVTLFLDTANNPPRTYDALYESPLHTGTALSRFNRVETGIFPDIPNPSLIGLGPRFNFNTLATEEYNRALGERDSAGHRFGLLGIGKFDPGSAGYNGVNDKVDRPFVYYLMSCYNRCDPRFLQSMRNFKYGAGYVGDIVVGFKPREHPNSQLFAYRTPLYYARTGCTTDFLGYCNVQTAARAPSFVSPEGTRGWMHFDEAHSSIGRGIGYYILTGDRMSHYITSSVYAPAVAFASYGARINPQGFQARSFGRLGHSIVDLYVTETDTLEKNYLVTTGDGIVQMVEDRRDDSAPGTRGIHPVTGQDYAVGFVDSFNSGGGRTCVDWQGRPRGVDGLDCEQRSFTWQDSKIIEGLTEMYRTMPLPRPVFTRTIIENMVFTQFTYGYKDVDQVINNYPGHIPGTTIREGTGYFSNGMVIGPPSGGYCVPPNCSGTQMSLTATIYTTYTGAFIDYNFPGLCNALKYAIPANHPNKAIWDQQLKRAVYGSIAVTATNRDAVQFEYERGVSVHEVHLADYICPLTYSLGIPTAIETPTALETDNDNDGFSELIGDCNDANNLIHPARAETHGHSAVPNTCNDNVDNNCNMLIDCDDPQCTTSIWGPNNGFCRGIAPNTLKQHLGDGIVQSPNFEGRLEQCDLSIIGGSSTNTCADGKCIPSNMFAEGRNGMCALAATCGDNRINQLSEQCDGTDLGLCPAGQCASQCLCNAPLLDNVSPTVWPFEQNFMLTINGDNFGTGMSIVINDLVRNSIPVTYINQQQITADIPAAITYMLGTGTQNTIKVRSSVNTDSRAITFRVGENTVTIPNPPSNLVVTPISSSQLRLDWQDNSNNEASFRLERRQLPGGSYDAVPGADALPANTITFQDNSLAENTPYEYRVSASNAAGQSAWSPVASGTTLPSIPNAPENLWAFATSSSEMTLGWRDASTNENNFIVEYKIATSPTWLPLPGAGAIAANTEGFLVSGLIPSTAYDFQVFAENSAGRSIASNPAQATAHALTPGVTLLNPGTIRHNRQRTVRIEGINFDPLFIVGFGLPGGIPDTVYCSFFDTYCRRISPTAIEIDIPAAAPAGTYPFRVANFHGLPQSNIVSLTVEATQCIDGIARTCPTSGAICGGALASCTDGALDACINNGLLASSLNGCPIPIALSFAQSLTTNFSQVADLTHSRDVSLGINGLGRIEYIGQEINLVRFNAGIYGAFNLDNAVRFANNLVSVDTVNYPELGQSATVTMNGLAYSSSPTPVIVNGTTRTTCPATQCAAQSYSNGNFVMAVSGFSNYSTQAQTCGDNYCNLEETCSSCASDCGACPSNPPSGGSGGGGGGGSGGTRTVVPVTECSDGRDNDGDGRTDYPNDPGCLNRGDNIELDVQQIVTPPEEEEEEQTPLEEIIELRIVFWTVLALLAGGIVLVVIMILHSLKKHNKFNNLARSVSLR